MKSKQIKRVIFIIADTLRAQNVGLYNPKITTTPNIDALGKSGVVFSNAYASITSTDPSVTSIMNGLYPLSLGLLNHGVNVSKEEERYAFKTTTLSEILKSVGFKTAALDWLSRWHKKGFSYYSGKIIKDQSFNLKKFKDSAAFQGSLPLFMRILDKIAIKVLRRDFFMRFYHGFSPNRKIAYDPANVIVKKAIEILNINKKSKLFLYLHLWDAHAPHTRSKGFKSYLFDSVDDTYNAEISFLDQEVGRLLRYLEKTYLSDKTLIIFTADHGENLYENDVAFNHENLYENVVKIPLIIKHPALDRKRINSIVQHIDIFPTILDLLGETSPPNIDGKSLVPVIIGKKKEIRQFSYFEDLTHRKLEIPKSARRRGIRMGKYKYIHTLKGENKELYSISPAVNFKIDCEELYNLKLDPQEKKNLAESRPRIVKRLRKRLEDLIFELNIKRLERDLKNNSSTHDTSSLF